MVAQTCTQIQGLEAGGSGDGYFVSNFVDVLSGQFATSNPEVNVNSEDSRLP